MANLCKTPTKAPTGQEETPVGLSRGRHSTDGGPKRASLMRRQVSASSLRSEGHVCVAELTKPRCHRSDSLSEPDPLVLSLLLALAKTGVPLSDVGVFESFLYHLGARRPIPSLAQIHHTFLPALARRHESALRRALRHRDAFVFLHEATTGDGPAALGVSLLPLNRAGKPPLLLGVEFLEQLSHAVVARAVARVLSEGHVLFHRVLAVVTSGSAPMVQAFAANGILGAVLLAALHVPCLLHQLELVMEFWQERLERLAMLLNLLEQTLGRRATLRHRYALFLHEHQSELPLPLLSPGPGPESWLEKAMDIAEHLPFLVEFVATDEEEGPLVSKLQTFLREAHEELVAEAMFVAEHAAELLNVARLLRQRGEPLAHRIYGKLDSLRMCFSYHADNRLGPKTERQLAFCQPLLAEQFQEILVCSLRRLEHLFESHPAMPTLRSVRALDPKQLGAVGGSRSEHEQGIPGLAEVPEIEWFRYQHLAEAAPADLSLPQWWEAQADQLPTLSPLARQFLWLPLSSPKSPFQPEGLLDLTGAVEGLTEESARLLRMIRYNRHLY